MAKENIQYNNNKSMFFLLVVIKIYTLANTPTTTENRTTKKFAKRDGKYYTRKTQSEMNAKKI